MTANKSALPPLLEKYFAGPQAALIEYWDEPKLREYQRDAVAEQLWHVWERNEFYRGKFTAAGVTPEDFHQLPDIAKFPFTEKDELRGQPYLLLSVPKEDVVLAHTSTGTFGGVWSYNLYSWEDLHVRDTAVFPHVLMGLSAADVVINALPYEMSSSGQSFQRSIQGAVGAMVVPVGKGGFYSDPVKTVKVMAELGATVLITTPPYAMVLAEVAQKESIRLGEQIALQRLWLTGEGCSPAYRRRLEERWNCRARVFYGSLECGPIAVEADEPGGLHISAGHVYLEIIDPTTGRPAAPGENGEVVCTILQRRASPLIRFRTQDLAMIDPHPPAGEIKLPLLRLRGRIAEQMQQGDGVAAGPPLSPYLIEDVLYRQVEVGGNYQIYTDGTEVRIEAEFVGEEPAKDEAGRRILEALAGQGVSADLAWVEHIPRVGGKTRRLRPLADRDEVMQQRCVLRDG